MPASTSSNSLRSTSGGGANSNSALSLAARFGDEENAKKVIEESMKKGDEEMEVGSRAMRAKEKTGQVEVLDAVVPAFD